MVEVIALEDDLLYTRCVVEIIALEDGFIVHKMCG